MNVSHFVRPNGETLQITAIQQDEHSIKIELENGHARWFRYNEIVIIPPYIKLVKRD